MIFPWLRGFFNPAPFTWVLLALNIFIFLATAGQQEKTQLFSKTREIELTGRMYEQFNEGENLTQDREQLMLLGLQGLRDPEFLQKAVRTEFEGDQIAIRIWKKNIVEFQNVLKERASYTFGLVPGENRPLTWLTYQFMHAGWLHLFSNMILLLLFASALEQISTGSLVLLLYIVCGYAGGLGFQLSAGSPLTPMVGASASLSGIMAFYAIYEKRKRVAFLYFLSPMQGYYGLIYLPTLLILPLCFLPDLAATLSTSAELGTGIANGAHIAGALSGALIALLMKPLKIRWPRPTEQNPV